MNKIIHYSLCIKARFCPEIIERILRVIRHRGFKLYSLNTIFTDVPNHKKINIYITVTSEKKIHLLYKQLNKIINIDNIIEI